MSFAVIGSQLFSKLVMEFRNVLTSSICLYIGLQQETLFCMFTRGLGRAKPS